MYQDRAVTVPMTIKTPTNQGIRPATRPLLSDAARLPAAVLVAACAVSTALLAAGLGHERHTDRVAAALDARARAGPAGHPTPLEGRARAGRRPARAGPPPVR